MLINSFILPCGGFLDMIPVVIQTLKDDMKRHPENTILELRDVQFIGPREQNGVDYYGFRVPLTVAPKGSEQRSIYYSHPQGKPPEARNKSQVAKYWLQVAK